MVNEHHSFYTDGEVKDYLGCTESKWTIHSPTLNYLVAAVRYELKRRGYDDLIIKNSLSDYSKSRELSFPVSLFCLMRGLMLPPALAAKNGDVTFWSHFNDNGSPKSRGWKKRFNDAVDRYYTNRFVDFSITRPNLISMITPPSEHLLRAYFTVLTQKASRLDLFCLTYDDNRDYYIFGISPSRENAKYIRVQVGAKFSMEIIKDISPVSRSKQDVVDIFQRKLDEFMSELELEGYDAEIHRG